MLTGMAAASLLLPGCAAALEMAALADLSLEELSNIEVTSVSRRAERLADAPASIFVITSEDIRRSGYKSLPEVLRLAPNLQVARSGAGGYAISARGFNNDNGLANKLLVLIDGRTVYSLSLSGVFWDMQDVMLEDIDRIEVISGPGGTLWGTNAVNGVINVITRLSRDTQGGLIAMGVGNLDHAAAARAGGTLRSGATFRVYAKADDIDNTTLASGAEATDGWERGQIGFRADFDTTPGRSFTLQGDTYKGNSDDRPGFGPIRVAGTNLLARWTRDLAGGQDLSVQAYYDHTSRDDELLFWDEIEVFDVEFQHGIPFGAHKLMWGADYRRALDDSTDSLFFGFVPSDRTLEWVSLFVQDEIRLTDGLDLTLGVRPERNDYTDWEYLPNARLAWSPADDQLVWTAVSHAVRAPARLDRELYFPPNGLFIRGGPDFVSEVADVYEVGYRAQPFATLSWSVTVYHTVYDKLRSGQLPPAEVQNEIDGTTDGVEAWATYKATANWRLTGGLASLREDLAAAPDSGDPVGPSALGNDPRRQWTLRSALDLTPRHELDIIVRHVGALPQPAVPSYTAVDARLAWLSPDRKTEIALALQNIFDPGHVEFGTAPGQSEYERAVFLKFTARD
jgi:iron complex outermembrane receptor protein